MKNINDYPYFVFVQFYNLFAQADYAQLNITKIGSDIEPIVLNKNEWQEEEDGILGSHFHEKEMLIKQDENYLIVIEKEERSQGKKDLIKSSFTVKTLS